MKDLIYCEDYSFFKISEYAKEPFFTYEFISIMKLFEEMRHNRVRMAIVLDEYGGTVGIVTLEDLVEEIVGEIEDEFDTQNDSIIKINDYEYIVDGRTNIELIREVIKINIESDEFDSIGGFLLGKIGTLPSIEDTIDYQNVTFTVLDISQNIIKRLKIEISN